MYRMHESRRRRILPVLTAALMSFALLVTGVFSQQGIPVLAAGNTQLGTQATSLLGPMRGPWADTSNGGPWAWGTQAVQSAPAVVTAPTAFPVGSAVTQPADQNWSNDNPFDEDGQGDDASTDGASSASESGSRSSDSSQTSAKPPAASTSNAKAEKAIEVALAQIGKPYVWAGDGPDNFDCSGLTKFAYKAAGIEIPRHSTTQLDSFPDVPMDKLQRGDLVGRTGHVAIYLGDGKVVEAKMKGTDVMISPLDPKRFQRGARPH